MLTIQSFGIMTTAVACLAVSTEALAQDYLGSYLDSKSFERQLERSQGTTRSGGDNRTIDRRASTPPDQSSKPAIASGSQRQAFRPSAAVQQRVTEQFAATLIGASPSDSTPHALKVLQTTFAQHEGFRSLLARQGGDSQVAIAATLGTQLQRSYPASLSTYGYSAQNFLDVTNAFLATAWAIVNDEELDRTQAFPALRAAAARQKPPKLSETDRQRNAQTLAMLTVLVDAASHANLATADRSALKAGLEDYGQRMGIDLRQVRLTSLGFERR